MPAAERRTVQRIHLNAPIPAMLGATRVILLEISRRGARVEHSTPFVEGARLRLTFRWEAQDISRECRVVRSKLTRSRDLGGIVYQSGLEFLQVGQRPASATRR